MTIACGQAYAHFFMPEEIARYRLKYPLVSFDVRIIDHSEAIAPLDTHEVDLAPALQPPTETALQSLFTCAQPLCAMTSMSYPLAGRMPVRFRDCPRYPLILPERATAGRYLYDAAAHRLGVEGDVVVTSNSFEFVQNYLLRKRVVGFQVMSGLPPLDRRERSGLSFRQVDARDAPSATLALGQLRGRALPVAAAKFAEQISRSIDQRLAAGV